MHIDTGKRTYSCYIMSRSVSQWAVPYHSGPHRVAPGHAVAPGHMACAVTSGCTMLHPWSCREPHEAVPHIVHRHGSHCLGSCFIQRFAEFGLHFSSQISNSQFCLTTTFLKSLREKDLNSIGKIPLKVCEKVNGNKNGSK